jgi:hypothetical protein
MAKKASKKKADPLATLLKLLARADREGARAVRILCKAIMEPVQEPSFKTCKFTYEKKKYSATLTSEHCKAILNVVKEQGNVLAEVGLLLAAENQQIVASIAGLMVSLTASGKIVAVKPIQLGCCMYMGGPTPNLSQAQCSQFPASSWDPADPNCTN